MDRLASKAADLMNMHMIVFIFEKMVCEIETAAQSVVSELDASGLKDMGRCMGELKTRYAGRMDFAKAGAKVKDLLASA